MSAAETIFRCRDSNEEASAQQHNSAASATRRDFLPGSPTSDPDLRL